MKPWLKAMVALHLIIVVVLALVTATGVMVALVVSFFERYPWWIAALVLGEVFVGVIALSLMKEFK